MKEGEDCRPTWRLRSWCPGTRAPRSSDPHCRPRLAARRPLHPIPRSIISGLLPLGLLCGAAPSSPHPSLPLTEAWQGAGFQSPFRGPVTPVRLLRFSWGRASPSLLSEVTPTSLCSRKAICCFPTPSHLVFLSLLLQLPQHSLRPPAETARSAELG